MKHADKNEVDLLLRSLARNVGASSAHREEAASGHLDADELNAFAEGLLPERARVRYSAHLADCDSCRRIVIGLTQATGLGVHRATVPERFPSTLFQQLTAFFSHPVLRFAIPAIVVASILGIGLIALRQDKPSDFIARHEPSEHRPTLDQENRAVPAESPSETKVRTETAPTPLGISVGTPPVDTPKGEIGSRAAGAGIAPEPPVMRKEADVQPAETTPTFAPDLNAPAAPPSLPAYAARDRAQTSAKEDAKREAEAAQADDVKVQTSEVVDERRNVGAASKAGTSQPKPGNVQGLMRERRGDDDKNKKDSTGRVDSRMVSGKRFVRQNNLWVDAAYESSRPTTNVKRGSEQYRALVADEPGIRSFAEQLSGAVIVVWKGRAYRFY